MATISINGVTVDPVAHGKQLSALSLASPDASSSDFVLIQVNEPLDAAKRKLLSDTGCELLEFVPTDTYIAHFTGTDLSQIRALPFVTWANVYLKGFKINPDLAGPAMADLAAANPVGAMAGEIGPPLTPGGDKLVDIILHKGAVRPDVYERIARAAGVDPDTLPAKGRKIRIRVPTRRLRAIADIDEVRHIEPVAAHTLFNDVAGAILRADAVHQGANGVAGLDGAGVVVAVCDTGFDKGDTVNVHPAFAGRVRRLYALGRPGRANDPHGHGTHVCGSVLGQENVPGYGRISGTAPAAMLVLQSVLDGGNGLGGLPTDLRELFAAPYDDEGARIHTNSWGATGAAQYGRYDSEAHAVDQFVFEHRDMLICFAAGNDGIDANRDGRIDLGTVTPPGTAKNCVTVGASESHRPGNAVTYGSLNPSGYPVSPLRDDRYADNPDGMAGFSSRGPTRDQRIKPDVVAPGTAILSTLSRDAQLQQLFGANPPAGYMYEAGTSMATPLVAGCAAITRQHLIRDRQIASPSAALVKAMLINGAIDLAGQYVPSEAADIPNFSEGFGRIDLARTVDPSVVLHDEAAALDTGQEASFQLQLPAGAVGLKATLAWSDPAGPSLQNDLDLIVTCGGAEAHGNMPVGASAFDRQNNVEQVVWSGLPANVVDVVVRAHRVALQPQSFALVLRFF
ncbi:MAG: S8 family serine peptidase [Dongiaceae bacterium]